MPDYPPAIERLVKRRDEIDAEVAELKARIALLYGERARLFDEAFEIGVRLGRKIRSEAAQQPPKP